MEHKHTVNTRLMAAGAPSAHTEAQSVMTPFSRGGWGGGILCTTLAWRHLFCSKLWEWSTRELQMKTLFLELFCSSLVPCVYLCVSWLVAQSGEWSHQISCILMSSSNAWPELSSGLPNPFTKQIRIITRVHYCYNQRVLHLSQEDCTKISNAINHREGSTGWCVGCREAAG